MTGAGGRVRLGGGLTKVQRACAVSAGAASPARGLCEPSCAGLVVVKYKEITPDSVIPRKGKGTVQVS